MSLIRKKMYRIIEPAEKGDLSSKVFDLFMLILIVSNILAVIFETVKPHKFYVYFEFFSVIIFTVEYLIRIWAAPENPLYRHPVTGRLRYAFTPLILIDLIAILPFYLPMIVGFDMRIIRVFRLFRIFRIFKLGRYSKAMHLLGRVFRNQKEELLIVVFIMIFMIIISASVMFYVENSVQPNHFRNIPQTMWWAVSTLTTVGYGDVIPATILGKVLGSFISILGIGLFALPTGILASGFTEEIRLHRAQTGRSPSRGSFCRHCGKPLD
ncbi:ion transporter [Myxococcota bacterium]|nr:ion transporter [Myxococcota bacterium]MBU1534055.1 ion transporter [Myxococcota bacterium]